MPAMALKGKKIQNQQYDVCLSFAGEDRSYVSKVASHLQSRGIRTFYDEYEQVALWGKDLYEHLADVYRNAAKYCVLFISKHYAKKLWANHERKAAQTRAFSENDAYILPARFDKTPIPGLLPTVGYIELQHLSPQQLSDLIVKKVGIPAQSYYLLIAFLHVSRRILPEVEDTLPNKRRSSLTRSRECLTLKRSC
jgi:hypothetical protein